MDKGFICISAFKGYWNMDEEDLKKINMKSMTQDENINLNSASTLKLKKQLEDLKLKYWKVEGAYIEKGIWSYEDSLLIPYFNEWGQPFKDFEKEIIKLGNEYNQDFILIKPPKEIGYLYFLNASVNPNTEKNLGSKINKENLLDYFTDLKYSNKNPKNFTVTEELEICDSFLVASPNCWSEAMCCVALGNYWETEGAY